MLVGWGRKQKEGREEGRGELVGGGWAGSLRTRQGGAVTSAGHPDKRT